MNYEKIYQDLIESRRIRGWTKKDNSKSNPIEIHHIVPKSMGGTNESSNLVGLTIREHVLAHLILAKARGGKYWRIAHGMTNGQRGCSRTLEIIKKRSRVEISKRMMGNKNGSYIWNEKRIQVHIDAMRRVGMTPNKIIALQRLHESNIGRIQSQDERNKRSVAMKSIKFVPVKAGDFEICSKGGKANKGIKKKARTKEHIEKIRKWHLENPGVQCKSVTIDGITYDSIKSAARALNLTVDAVRYRARSTKYSNYKFEVQL